MDQWVPASKVLSCGARIISNRDFDGTHQGGHPSFGDIQFRVLMS